MKNVNTVKQYRAQLFDQNGSVTINGTSLAHVQQTISRVLGSNSRLSDANGSMTRAILLGNEPVGWIVEMDVPQHLSIAEQTYSETKRPAEKVA